MISNEFNKCYRLSATPSPTCDRIKRSMVELIALIKRCVDFIFKLITQCVKFKNTHYEKRNTPLHPIYFAQTPTYVNKGSIERCVELMKSREPSALQELESIIKNYPSFATNFFDSKGRSLLFQAVDNNNLEAAKILIECGGANVDLISREKPPKTCLSHAVLKRSPEMITLLMDKKANPYVNIYSITTFDIALEGDNIENIHLLFNKNSTRELYELISTDRQENLDAINQLLDTNEYSITDLTTMFLIAVRKRHFEACKILYKNGLSKFKTFQSPENDEELDKKNELSRDKINQETFDYFKKYFKENCNFKGSPFESRSEAFINAFAKIKMLLYDVPLCTKLLEEIDKKLENLYPDLKNLEPGEGVVMNGYRFPSEPGENWKFCDTGEALDEILYSILAKEGIDTQKFSYVFSEFIAPEIANEIVAEGALFEDYPFLGTSFTHGRDVHRLVFALLALLIQQKGIELEGVTLLEILQATVTVFNGSKPIWMDLIDVIPSPYAKSGDPFRKAAFFEDTGIPTRFSLDSPINMHCFLLFSDKLKSLRGYYLNLFYQNFEKMKKLVFEKFTKELLYIVILGQVLVQGDISRFDLGLTETHALDWNQRHDKMTPFAPGIFKKERKFLSTK